MKNKIRIIARLDIKAPYVVKGIQMEGVKKLADPNQLAKLYYEQGIDEILCIDIVASLYNRNSLLDIVMKATDELFIPIAVGGGIRSVEDARQLLRAGADKIAINTAAIKNPRIITELANTFGSQSVVVSIQAKQFLPNKWEVYYDCGREHTGMDVLEWAQQVESYGAGEILVTSVDRDGTKSGCDYSLIRAITQLVSIPVISSGGVGKIEDVIEIVKKGKPDAIAIASAFHFNYFSISMLKNTLQMADISTRNSSY